MGNLNLTPLQLDSLKLAEPSRRFKKTNTKMFPGLCD